MKKLIIMLTGGLLSVSGAYADGGSFSQTFAGGTIPVNAVGTIFSGDFNTASVNDQIVGVTVDMNITGGLASGFYAYLIAPDSTLAVLLNQPGVTPDDPFGNLGSGLDLRLADGGTTITASSNLSLGTGSPYAAVDALATFGSLGSPGGSANGTWNLFITDLTDNGETPTLNNWSLNLTVEPAAVPEPTAFNLLGLASLALLAGRKYFQHA
jgi:subtilisin-like proprotein convertase family protein